MSRNKGPRVDGQYKASVYCPYCLQQTAPRVAPSASTDSYGEHVGEAAWWKHGDEVWWIGLCNYCEKPMLIRNSGAIVFPHPAPSPTDKQIPEPMRIDLIEAKQCHAIKASRAAAVLARRAIEAAANERGAKKSKLVDKIDELFEQRVLTEDVRSWAHAVRWVANDAAHPNESVVTTEDAEDILRLAEQLLHYLYVTPALAKTLRDRRAKG